MSFGHLNHGKSPLEVEQVTGQMSDIVSFGCAEAVTAGDWVDLDSSQAGEARVGTVVQGNATSLCIGVALEDVSAAQVLAGGAMVRVCVAGYCENVKTTGAIGSGVAFTAGAAGAVQANVAATITPVLGVALEAAAGDTVDCYIFRQL
tara:strand:+ start:375 stop:818 length:444 start_codon:yes stop_codon:yes gene_type:complete